MERDEIQRRITEAKSRGDEIYWEDWMATVEWSQFVSAWALVQDWDKQLVSLVSQGCLPDHPLAPLYSPDNLIEGCRT